MVSYINIDFVESFLNKTFTEDSYPNIDQVNEYIELSEKEFEDKIGSFRLKSTVYEGRGTRYGIRVYDLPINTINKIYRNIGDDIEEDWFELDKYDFKVEDKDKGIIFLRYPNTNNTFKVEYNSGYTNELMPLNIKRLVCLYTLRHIFNNTIFSTDGNKDVTETIDVDLYRKVTNKSAYIDGILALDIIIEKTEGEFGQGLKSFYIRDIR